MTNSETITDSVLDIEKIRRDFPILKTKVYGKPLIYLDNAATTQKPQPVLESLHNYYTHYNSNVHRGVHFLSQQATEAYEVARRKIAGYINARHEHEIIFTKGTTNGINLVAASFGKKFLKAGDEVLISAMEHHSNIVPWQLICEEKGATLKVIPIDEAGELKMDGFDELLTDKVKIVAVTYVSNSLGTVNPVHEIIQKAHAVNVPVLIDAAQAIQHMPIDIQQLDADFLAFSGHKIYGPTGVGILYGKEKWLNEMPPYEGGGDMIKNVTFAKTTYNELPFKFEAGTPDISGGIALGAAIDYVQHVGISAIQQAEEEVVAYAYDRLSAIPSLRFIGDAKHRSGAISFLVGNIHPFDLGEILDKQSIAVRTGHHCTQPVMDFFQIPGTVRASFAFYNTKAEVDALVDGIEKAKRMLE
ncbi:cysteine desulfurase [Agriterribacter sp.]|uniref:aminotransferase class V-fold PLP-dependent enzyme n=1 Tax=Agriterribacter sp. TaxID=2821509 RepID=UPI002C6D1DEF|nr:cysteine desulfurase [Agriterribacter sp.]HRO46421.1 cysteine desulfurase [Agriterribacter sp.]HRQ17609.1 cysteine desulfurase [Agriterribacter sp.]